MLTYFLNDFEMVSVAPIITGITFVFTFHMRRISIVRIYYYYYYYYYCEHLQWRSPLSIRRFWTWEYGAQNISIKFGIGRTIQKIMSDEANTLNERFDFLRSTNLTLLCPT
jgi:hypothetical protein